MFSSVEISTSEPLRRSANPYPLEALTSRLRDVEQLPVFRRAFPDDNGEFMKMFQTVVELEFKRARIIAEDSDDDESKALRYTEPDAVVHDPCYDVQSIYWSLLWFFVRVLPEGREPRDDLDGDFSKFAEKFLAHTVGDDYLRARDLFLWHCPKAHLHPDLVHFAKLFRGLALYLSVPWHM